MNGCPLNIEIEKIFEQKFLTPFLYDSTFCVYKLEGTFPLSIELIIEIFNIKETRYPTVKVSFDQLIPVFSLEERERLMRAVKQDGLLIPTFKRKGNCAFYYYNKKLEFEAPILFDELYSPQNFGILELNFFGN